jgi:hypothetical protein
VSRSEPAPTRNRRALILELTAASVVACILAVGVVALVDSWRDHRRVTEATEAANGWQARAQSRRLAERHAVADLKHRLNRRKSVLTTLRSESSTGFLAARESGRVSGWRAAQRVGRRQGRADGRAERSLIESSGWYMARIAWDERLPILDESWTIDQGSERAYYFSGGEGHYRDTVGTG